jgi:hypothetical protein
MDRLVASLRLDEKRHTALDHALREWLDRASQSDRLRGEIEAVSREMAVSRTMYREGYHFEGTGGNCEAWVMRRARPGSPEPTGAEQWICTEDSGLYGDPGAPVWLVGVHGSDGGYVQVPRPVPLKRAIGLARWLRAPVDGEQADVEVE